MFFSGQLARFHHWQHRDLWAFCKWVALSVLVGSTVGLVSSAFAFCLSQVTAFRQAHFWVLFCLPLAGLVILMLYHVLNMDNDGGTEFIQAAAKWFDDNDVLWATYWDSDAGHPGRLSDGSDYSIGAAFQNVF